MGAVLAPNPVALSRSGVNGVPTVDLRGRALNCAEIAWLEDQLAQAPPVTPGEWKRIESILLNARQSARAEDQNALRAWPRAG